MKKRYLISICVVLMATVGFGIIGATFLLVFPLRFEETILEMSERYELDPAFIAAVINVESGFNHRAVSDRGARGLMQLMPTTAMEIAISLGFTEFSVEQLFDPAINIEFGSYYLRYLKNKFNDDKTLVLASYNAGFNNVNTWLLNSEYSQDGQTLDSTPFRETNNFIKRVNRSIWVYGRRIG